MSTGRKRSLSGPACSSPAKRKKYLCKYQKAWEAEFSWLSHSDRSEKKKRKEKNNNNKKKKKRS